MKLQPKKQLNTQYQETRRIEIEEGVKLAKKIDVLRETLASLEAQHTKFLAGTRKELDEATKDKHIEIERLRGEVRQLEEQRKILLEPLDEEWDKVKEKQAELEVKEATLNIRDSELQEKEKGIEKTKEQTEKTAIEVKNKWDEVERVTRETNTLNVKAKELHSSKQTEYEDFDKDRKTRLADIEAKEKANSNQAVFNEHQKSILNKREKELNNKEKKLNDRWALLERTIKRIK